MKQLNSADFPFKSERGKVLRSTQVRVSSTETCACQILGDAGLFQKRQGDTDMLMHYSGDKGASQKCDGCLVKANPPAAWGFIRLLQK